jgi:hypothetical protein
MLTAPGGRAAHVVSLVAALMVVAQLLLCTMVQPTAARWPGPVSSMTMYECCCDEEYECGGCYVCRNHVYSCYCESCSCYAERAPQRTDGR